jgi:hypothetical protein
MKKNLHGLYSSLLMIVAVVAITGCINDGGRAGRPFIEDFGLRTPQIGCGDLLFNGLDATCVSQCPVGTELASESDLDEILEDASDEFADILLNSRGVCIEEFVQIARPDNQVNVRRDFCSCLNRKPDILNNCDAFCSSRNSTAPTLFGTVDLGPEILLNQELGNLHNWCNKEIDDGLTSPSCVLEVFDGFGTQRLNMSIPVNSNTFSVVLQTLEFNTTYVARIVEQTSGARSNAFQIIRKEPQDNSGPQGPLKIMAVSQYSCVLRSFEEIGNDIFFENAVRQHFYFPSNNNPPPLPPGDPRRICHDPAQGTTDSPLKPRLELIPQHFAVWDISDLRFIDVNPQDGSPDINTQIRDRLLREFNVNANVNLFGLLTWPNAPDSGPQNLGIFMQPFVNPQTGRAFCPGRDEYDGDDPIFKILGEIVGVPTEGVYLAEKEPEVLFDGSGNPISTPQDILLIRENLLKQIWFYFENNRHYVPDQITANTKTIMFYYPPDPIDPFTKKSDQRIYTIRSPQNLGQQGNIGLNTSIPAPDRRFGCIPAVN